MSPVSTARVTLDVDLRTSPIEGSLSTDGGIPQPFVGYMQLVTLLEGALQTARAGTEAAPTTVESNGPC